MASMTIEELKVAIQALGFDANTKAVILVGQTAGGKYQFVLVDDSGAIVTATP